MFCDNGFFKTIPVTFERKPEQSKLQVAHISGQLTVGGQIKKNLVKQDVGLMKISIFFFFDGLFHDPVVAFHHLDLIAPDPIKNRKNHLGFECPDNFKEIQQIFIQQDIDQDATLGQNGYQALDFQLGKRLAQGCAADIQLFGQFAHVDQGARYQRTHFYLLAEVIENFFA